MAPTEKKTWVMLENNPTIMTTLASRLGIAPNTLSLNDIYSLDLSSPSTFNPFSHIPRPCLALLVIIPPSPAWFASRQSEDALPPATSPYTSPLPKQNPSSSSPSSNPDPQPIIWFKQTIGHACGSIGLLHCLLNTPLRRHILLGSDLADIRDRALAIGHENVEERAELLYNHAGFEAAHKSVERQGDSAVLGRDSEGGHFVAFVKGDDGRLWELEGSRKGPLERGWLGEEEDVLSKKALELGLGRIIDIVAKSGEEQLLFSAIALTEKE